MQLDALAGGDAPHPFRSSIVSTRLEMECRCLLEIDQLLRALARLPFARASGQATVPRTGTLLIGPLKLRNTSKFAFGGFMWFHVVSFSNPAHQ